MTNEQPPKYLIDTCSLLELRLRYPEETFSGVWRKIDELIEAGALVSCEDVYLELQSKDDDMSEWAKQRKEMFIPVNDVIQEIVVQILTSHPNLLDLKKDKSGGDPFVIATAKFAGCIVVTEETPTGNVEKRSKIPDVCPAYDVECVPLLALLMREDLRL